MAIIVIAVIGASDLVDPVADAAIKTGAARVQRLVYRNEAEAVGLVRSARTEVNGFLFTGIVPYTLALNAGVLQEPANYVPYSGATLLLALVQLLRSGQDITRMSIDTLSEHQVRETLHEAELPARHVHVLEYEPGTTSQDIADFHLHARDEHGVKVAVTCLRSVYDALREEMHTFRLMPSVHSMQAAAQSLVLRAVGAQRSDAQVALGFVEVAGTEPELAQDVRPLGGSLTRIDENSSLIVTTRGLLEQVTGDYAHLPMLARLAENHEMVRIGFGIGETAAHAEALARRALGRARAAGDVAAAVAPSEDADILIGAQLLGPTAEENIPRLAQRAGLNRKTLVQLREIAADQGEAHLTAAVVAEHLGLQQRTARRILKRLERAGAVEPVGMQNTGTRGRPRIIYRVRY